MKQELLELAERLKASLGSDLAAWNVAFDELTIEVLPAKIVAVLKFLRDDPLCRFIQLIDLTCVDYPQRAKRFDVVYHLLSLHNNQRIRVKCPIGEEETIASVVDVYPCADWFEREAFDMYGVVFAGHPDMRRILTDYGFEGYPLRKDFPLTGYVEVRYDDQQKRVVYEPVSLVQEYRNFDYLSPWEGAKYVLPGDEKAK
ncbi:MAG: NADH-quinone oxidoreductase subunit C [Parvularculaceae bacterium]|jgi:NADH-quinone oxidoreductase subunit C|nr:NADH-quinone oxidoreductase subunit C [Parvularculaceae bacterium]